MNTKFTETEWGPKIRKSVRTRVLIKSDLDSNESKKKKSGAGRWSLSAPWEEISKSNQGIISLLGGGWSLFWSGRGH